MKEMVGDVELYFRQRNGATYDHPSKIALLGADETSEDTNWEVVDSLEIPNVGDGAENRVSFHVETPFKYTAPPLAPRVMWAAAMLADSVLSMVLDR